MDQKQFYKQQMGSHEHQQRLGQQQTNAPNDINAWYNAWNSGKISWSQIPRQFQVKINQKLGRR